MVRYEIFRRIYSLLDMKSIELNSLWIVSNARKKIGEELKKPLKKSLTLSQGLVSFLIEEEYQLISAQRSCPEHGHGAPELEPRLFSFNAPQGMCLSCSGIGYIEGFRYNEMIDPDASMLKAFTPMNEDGRIPFSHLDLSIWKLVLKTPNKREYALEKSIYNQERSALEWSKY